MKFSLLCLSAAFGATSAFVLPTQRRSVATLSSSSTQLQVAAEPEVMNEVTKPRRTRQVRSWV